jgi:hypothetical protein
MALTQVAGRTPRHGEGYDRLAANRVGIWWNLDRERAARPEPNRTTDPDPSLLPWDADEDTRGWNRISLTWRGSKPPKPNIQAADLIMPSSLGTARSVAMCFLMALMITVLYIWFPMFGVAMFVHIPGSVYGGVMAGSPIALTLLLYVFGSRETKRDREYAARL